MLLKIHTLFSMTVPGDSRTFSERKIRQNRPVQYDAAMKSSLVAMISLLLVGSAFAQTSSRPASQPAISKGHRILIQHGLQIHALGFPSDPFHLPTLTGCNFTGVNWNWESSPKLMGPPPGLLWNRWARDEGEITLKPAEQPYSRKLIAWQLRDEQNLNDPKVLAAAVKWFNATRKRFPNTILYSNQYGGQVTTEALARYYEACHPDMLSFDTYPMLEAADNWNPFFGDLQRYRKLALGWGIPYACWIQTFHGEDKYRDPSDSEMRLNQFAPWTFGYTMVTAFTYNAGSTNLFRGPGDQNPKLAYQQLKTINRESLNLGPALVRLRSTDVRIVPGQHIKDGKPADNEHVGWVDVLSWKYRENDPYIRGFAVKNLGSRNDGLRGNLYVGWFKPLEGGDEIYLMITNGLVDRNSTGAECRQRVSVNLHFEKSGISGVQRLSRETGKTEDVELVKIAKDPGRFVMNLDLNGGTGDLLKFKTGAAFVGAPLAPAPAP